MMMALPRAALPYKPCPVCGAEMDTFGPEGYVCCRGHRLTMAAYREALAASTERAAADGSACETSELSEESRTWPQPLADWALRGLAGDIVRAVDPHTEADQAAVLLQFLAGFANAVGASPKVLVGATPHGARLFIAVVGDTARARKGDSWQYVWKLLRTADAEWAQQSIATGLSTGEGLINAVRDALDEADANVPDRRVLAVETELGRTLRAMARDGNTLSAILRDAWDGRDLRVMTRGTPLRASGAHVGLIGHITLAELRRELSSTDAHNGFANRFAWACVKRSKILADPAPLPAGTLDGLAGRVREALDLGRHTDAVQRDEAARDLWKAIYPDLTKDRDGLAGDVLARSEAQVLRLSLVYALLDGSRFIRPEHLASAVAVWDYCTASVRHIFGNASGDSVADDILRFLLLGGERRRTDISAHLGRHVRSDRISQALKALERSGRATCRKDESTGGAPAEVWRATGKTEAPADALLPHLLSLNSLVSHPRPNGVHYGTDQLAQPVLAAATSFEEGAI